MIVVHSNGTKKNVMGVTDFDWPYRSLVWPLRARVFGQRGHRLYVNLYDRGRTNAVDFLFFCGREDKIHRQVGTVTQQIILLPLSDTHCDSWSREHDVVCATKSTHHLCRKFVDLCFPVLGCKKYCRSLVSRSER